MRMHRPPHVLLVILFLTNPVLAVPVTYQFTGHIAETTATGSELQGLVSTASVFSGRFTYDSQNYTLNFPSATVPYYYHYIDTGANFRMSMQIDGHLDFATGSAGITVAEDEPIAGNWGGDGYYVESTNLRGAPGSLPLAWDLPYANQEWWLQFRFFSLGTTAFESFALTAPMLMDAMVVKEIRISAGDLTSYGWLAGNGYQITGVIDSIQVVPLPAGAWLLGGGLALLAACRRRQVA